MKKVFLLFVALASSSHATDVAMNCGQQGFQVSAQLGYGLTSASNKVDKFSPSVASTSNGVRSDFEEAFNDYIEGELEGYDNYIYTLGLDYNNLEPFHSVSSLSAGLSLGYKWLLNCNQYSITSNLFVQYNGASLYSDLRAKYTNFEAIMSQDVEDPDIIYKYVQGSVGGESYIADRLTLTSGPVFGFNFLLAKEFNWGNAGLLLGMKFNSYKLKYFEVSPQLTSSDVVRMPGYLDFTDPANGEISLDIKSYLGKLEKSKVATGFTVGFSSNYYISDNLSAGLTVFYDMYAPVTFDIDVTINPYTIGDDNAQRAEQGTIKFQNNTIGFMMNLTYSFGAN